MESLGLVSSALSLTMPLVSISSRASRWPFGHAPKMSDAGSVGLQILHDAKDECEVDFILVHGFTGHPRDTWSSDGADNKCFWPTDLLACQMPRSRIFTFNYATILDQEISTSLKDLGKLLLESVSRARSGQDCAGRPIMFLAHSLGGLVVESALALSYLSAEEIDHEAKLVASSTAGVVLFGTPHRGLDTAAWDQSMDLFRILFRRPFWKVAAKCGPLLESTAKDDFTLTMSVLFKKLVQHYDIPVLSLCEEKMSTSIRGRFMVVDKDAAKIHVQSEEVCSMNADHLTLTKFNDVHDAKFGIVLQFLTAALTGRKDIQGVIRARLGPNKRTSHMDDSMEEEEAEQQQQQQQQPPHESATLIPPHLTFEKHASVIESERLFLSRLQGDWLQDTSIQEPAFQTCEWILATTEFQRWLEGDGMLWISGSPGTGKSVLAKFLHRHIRRGWVSQTHREPESTGDHETPVPEQTQPPYSVIYFFDRRVPSRARSLTAVRSILLQLLVADRSLFRHVYARKLFKSSLPADFNLYVDVIRTIVKDTDFCGLCLILDGLDECDESSLGEMSDLVDMLAVDKRIKLIITSRLSSTQMTGWLTERDHIIQLDNMNAACGDIIKAIQPAIIALGVRKGIDKDSIGEVLQYFMRYPPSSFVWSELVLQDLRSQYTLRAMRQTLASTPRTLSQLISARIAKVPLPDMMDMMHALYFVAEARARLTLSEISILLAFTKVPFPSGIADTKLSQSMTEVLQDRILDFESFIHVVDPLLRVEEGYVTLMHDGVRQLLRKSLLDPEVFDEIFPAARQMLNGNVLSVSKVNAMMARACLSYILVASIGNERPMHLMAYSALYWPEHIRNAGEQCPSDIVDLAIALHRAQNPSGKIFDAWRRFYLSMTAPGLLLPSSGDVISTFAAFDLCHFLGKRARFGPSLHSSDAQGWTPLHLAAANNSTFSIYWMFNLESKPSHEKSLWELDREGNSPLDFAIVKGNVSATQVILRATQSIPRVKADSFEAAIRSNNTSMLECLLKYGNLGKNYTERISLSLAVHNDDVQSIRQLIDSKAEEHTRATINEMFLFACAQNESAKIARFLVELGADIRFRDERQSTGLFLAAQRGHSAIVRLLAERGASVDPYNNACLTPLLVATQSGHADTVKTLLQCGSFTNMPDLQGRTPVHFAAANGNNQIVKILAQGGADLISGDFHGRTPLHEAIRQGHYATMDLLFSLGASILGIDSNGRSAIHHGVLSGDVEMVQRLLQKRATVDARDNDEVTPLHLAVLQDSGPIAELLIQYYADVNAVGYENMAPVHYACSDGKRSPDLLTTLVVSGAKLSARDKFGRTALHFAVQAANVGVVKRLLEIGADPRAADDMGRTAGSLNVDANEMDDKTKNQIKLMLESTEREQEW